MGCCYGYQEIWSFPHPWIGKFVAMKMLAEIDANDDDILLCV